MKKSTRELCESLRRITTGGHSIYFPGVKSQTCQKAATLIEELSKDVLRLKRENGKLAA